MEYNFLDLTLTPHDKNNIELKISYLFHRHTPKNDYEVETYFFIPKNLAVNERQLSNNDFYKRLHNYVRLKTPQINLDCVSNLKPSSPLINLETAINNLILNPGDYRLAKKYEYEIKMAGSIIKSSLRDYTEFIRDKKPAENDRIRLLNQYLKYSESILANISRLWETICIPDFTESLLKQFLWFEEYVLITINLYSGVLCEIVKKRANTEREKNLAEQFENLINKNLNYRQVKHNEPLPQTETDKERYVRKARILKKFISSVLFLNISVNEEKKKMEHIFYAFAAGISMIFATLFAFYFNSKYGNYSFPLLVALVVSYMGKDRMKAMGQEFSNRFLYKHGFDHKIKITVPDFKNSIGFCREKMRFLKEKETDDKIKILRQLEDSDKLMKDVIGETILYYRKKINLFTDRINMIYPEINGVIDIIRYSMVDFLENMDDPKTSLYIPEKDGFRWTSANKVYVVFFVAVLKFNNKEIIKNYRIVLNKNGIVKIVEEKAQKL